MNVFCQAKGIQKPFFHGVFNFWKNQLFPKFSTSFCLTLTACIWRITNPIHNLKILATISYNYERFLPSQVKSGTVFSWCNSFLKKVTFLSICQIFGNFWYYWQGGGLWCWCGPGFYGWWKRIWLKRLTWFCGVFHKCS